MQSDLFMGTHPWSSQGRAKGSPQGLKGTHLGKPTGPIFHWRQTERFWRSLDVTWMGFPGGSYGKESACNVGDLDSISGLWKSPGEGNGYPLHCSCLESPMDRGAWWASVHSVTKSWTCRIDTALTHTHTLLQVILHLSVFYFNEECKVWLASAF